MKNLIDKTRAIVYLNPTVGTPWHNEEKSGESHSPCNVRKLGYCLSLCLCFLKLDSRLKMVTQFNEYNGKMRVRMYIEMVVSYMMAKSSTGGESYSLPGKIVIVNATCVFYCLFKGWNRREEKKKLYDLIKCDSHSLALE